MKKQTWRLFTSLLGVSLLLPLVLMSVLYQGRLSLFSSASQAGELRLWFEPQLAVSRVGKPVTVTVMANYDQGDQVLPYIWMNIRPVSGLQIEPTTIKFNQNFGGETDIATITVTGQRPGEYEIPIDQKSVQTGKSGVSTTTSSVKILVK